jgi:hypothetical protein
MEFGVPLELELDTMAAHTCLHSVLKMQPSEACAHFCFPDVQYIAVHTCSSIMHADQQSCHMPSADVASYLLSP